MSDPHRLRNVVATVVGLALLAAALYFVDVGLSSKLRQVVALFAIWGIAAVSLNLINGTTGILSLGHHGFMLLGGYTTALLTLPQVNRDRISDSARSLMNDFTLGLSVESWARALGLEALASPDALWIRYLVALVIGGLVAALFGLVVGIPSLRLRGDYLAIVTFGFGEIIRLLASTDLMSPFTNGSLGYTGVPSQMGDSVWWTFGILAVTVFVMAKLKFSSYGRALQAIREDEIAAEAMGVALARHKVFAFTLSAFFAGVAGGLYVSWLSSARLDSFLFFLTFFFLVAISVGGTGSVTGTLIGTGLVVFVLQYGGPLEQAYPLWGWVGAGGAALLVTAAALYAYRRSLRLRPVWHPVGTALAVLGVVVLAAALLAPSFGWLDETFRAFGLRRISLAVILVVIMVFRPEGLLGRQEFSWAWLFRDRRDEPSEEERAQDAWLSNPELNEEAREEEEERQRTERRPAARDDDPLPKSLTEEESPGAHPLLETGTKPEPEGGRRRPRREDDEGSS